jgi:DNA-binding CsgD family transcriptional regulator
MTKRERQLLGCLAACLAAPAGEGALEIVLAALGRLLGAPLVTFGLQEIATRRILYSARAEVETDDDGPADWSAIPSDTGALRSLFRVVPVGDQRHRLLLGGFVDVADDDFTRALLAELAPRLAELALKARQRRDQPAKPLAERALELLPLPLLLLREDGSIALESRAAQAAFHESSPLRRVDGVLQSCDGRLAHHLHQLLHGPGGSGDATLPTVLPLPRTGKRPLSLALWRVPVVARLRDGTGACALVVICDPDRRPAGVRELLMRGYGLTASEVRVTLAVLDGKSIEQLTGELYISLNTAKTHLKSIFAKVGACRQSELVAAVLGGPIGLLR